MALHNPTLATEARTVQSAATRLAVEAPDRVPLPELEPRLLRRFATLVCEWIDGAPIVGDFDGDGVLEVFFVAGKGTSDKSRQQNYGRAYALKLGKGKGSWPMFRGNLRRTGTVGF
jgi:hypothetical protein